MNGLRISAIALTLAALSLAGYSAGSWDGEYESHGPILIEHDSQFTAENGVTAGSGTAIDPFIIEGWEIDASSVDTGIRIYATSSWFVVRNCYVRNAITHGICLHDLTNGRVTACVAEGSQHGITLSGGEGNVIEDCLVRGSSIEGLTVWGQGDHLLVGNTCAGNNRGIHIDECSSVTIQQNTITGNELGISLGLDAVGNHILQNTLEGNLGSIGIDETASDNDIAMNTFVGSDEDLLSGVTSDIVSVSGDQQLWVASRENLWNDWGGEARLLSPSGEVVDELAFDTMTGR